MELRLKTNAGAVARRWELAGGLWPKRAVRAFRDLPWESAAGGALAQVRREGEESLVRAILESVVAKVVAGRVLVKAEGAGLVARGVAAAGVLGRLEERRGRKPADGRDGREVRLARLGIAEAGVDGLVGDALAAENAVREWVDAPFTGRNDPGSGKDLTEEDLELGTDGVCVCVCV